MSIHLDLTRQFNAGRLRAIVCSGQAVVLLRLAIASKDGDWIVREDDGQGSAVHRARRAAAHQANRTREGLADRR